MPFVNHCFRHMWQYPAASIVLSIDRPSSWTKRSNIFKFIETFTKWLLWVIFTLYVRVSQGWHRNLTWALCWWSMVKELSICTRSWKNDLIFLFIKFGKSLLSYNLVTILSCSFTVLHQMVMNIIHVKKIIYYTVIKVLGHLC